jgi:2-oxo-hept-3-ene-1,7-dioate hydratase
MGIDEPDYGVITDDMVFSDGDAVPTQRFIFPRVEIELAFFMAKPLAGRDVTVDDVLSATSHIVPAIEILDSRVEMEDSSGHRRTIVDTIADNAADAGVVVGVSHLDPSDLVPRSIGGELLVNGAIEETGLGTAVLGNPAASVAWLVDKLAQHGDGIESGQLVLSGSLVRSIPVRAGDEVVGDFGDLGAVSCRFV